MSSILPIILKLFCMVDGILLNINEFIKEKNLNKSKLSEDVGYSRQHVYDFLNGRQRLTVEFLVKFSAAVNKDPCFWFESSAKQANAMKEDQVEYGKKDQVPRKDYDRLWEQIKVKDEQIKVKDEQIKKANGQIEFLESLVCQNLDTSKRKTGT